MSRLKNVSQKISLHYGAAIAAAVVLMGTGACRSALAESRSPSADQASTIRTLYQSGEYSELVGRLDTLLGQHPSDYRQRAILVTVLLKLHDQTRARAELDTLKRFENPGASVYVSKLESLFASLEARDLAKRSLTESLENFDAEGAQRKIAQFPASAAQRAILTAYLDVYEAQFEQAHNVAMTLRAADADVAAHLQERIAHDEREFRALQNRLDLYLYSPLAVSVCESAHPDLTPELRLLKIEDYFEEVAQLAQLAPLDDSTLGLLFHAQMIVAESADLNALGDRILAARGSLKIPFYSSDRFFKLVIDTQKRRLYTEADSHPFKARYTAKFFGISQNTPTNPWNADLVPFDLPFDAITTLKQDTASAGGIGTQLSRKSYALRLEPLGVAPHYALMHILECSAGDGPQRRATRNLGDFLLHVMNNPRIKATLMDPGKASTGPSAFSQAVSVLSAGMAQQSALQRSVAVAAAAEDRRRELSRQEQGSVWYSVRTNESFALLEREMFADYEKLLQLSD